MSNPFVTPEDLLETSKKYHTPNNKTHGEDFFINAKYAGNASRVTSITKTKWSFLTIIFVIFLLWSRVFYLQISQSRVLYGEAEGNRIRTELVLGPRGLFYDRHQISLAVNKPQFSLVLERDFVNQFLKESANAKEELKNKLTLITGLKKEEIQMRIEKFLVNNKQPALDFELDYPHAMIFKASGQESLNWQLQLKSERQYLEGYIFGNVLGYLGRINPDEWAIFKNNNYRYTDLIGQAGLEEMYEKELRGLPGKIEREVNAKGEEVKILGVTATIPGVDLTLTIDYELTKKINSILSAALEELNLKKAAAVALDPRNGEILALVSLPGFDNNYFTNPAIYSQEIAALFSDENQPLFNRPIAGEYPSGSTIKPMIAAAGLNEGLINKNTTVLSTGGFKIDQWFFPDWKAGGHGITNVIKALAESVNTFFYYLGGGYENFNGLGLEKITAYAKLFGFGKKSGIDLPGEQTGFLPTKEWKEETKKESWYIGDTYHLSIGQGDILVTPLQIANMTSAIANGGTLYQPHLVKDFFYPKENKHITVLPKVLNSHFILDDYLAIVRQGMRQAVVSGSARALADSPFSSGAKTGTAQVGDDKNPHAWFTVFAPYENPEIILTILIENGGEGSVTALPVAKEILEWYFGRK